MMRAFFVAAPALCVGVLISLVFWEVGVVVSLLLFGIGMSATKPRPERGEGEYDAGRHADYHAGVGW